MADINDIGRITEEFEQFANIDISTFSPVDQMHIMTAYIEMIQKVRPIYIKNLAKNPSSDTFLFKL